MATTVSLKPNAVELSGSTSGTTTLQATAVAGTTTITLPAATDTLVGKATTDTLTNKTLTSPTITTPTINQITSATSTNLTLQSAGTTAVTIDTSQNVGIGTTSPSYKLSVTSTNISGDTGAIQVTSPSTDGTQFRINNTGSGGHSYTFYSTGSSNGPGAGALGIYDQTAGAYRSVITSNGYLCLGGATNTTYNETLRIATANQQGIHINETTSSSSCNYQYFTKGSGPTNVGAIYYNGSTMAYQTTSDYRLKENVTPISNALATVALLKPSAYRWKESQTEDTGFIAHELQQVFPQAVSGEKDAVDERGNPVYQGIDVSFLVATLTAAIQELKAINDTQAETINALTVRVVALEAK